ncbi:MAG: sulfatase family protein [Candidatus Cyclobacteriaceae bacterium M3_2C_046]
MKPYKYIWPLLVLGMQCQPQSPEENSSSRTIKNIVVIISDDHSIETIGAYGNQQIRTPNMDALAREGMLFQNAYANSPICAPSRQSILSGKYPHATGVSLVFTPFPDYGNTTIAEVLQEEGFATAMIGKNHFNNFFWSDLYKGDYPTYGFDTIFFKRPQYEQWLKKNPMPDLLASAETRYSDKAAHKNPEYQPEAVYDSFAIGTFYAREAIQFMQQQKEKNQPFFLWLAFHEPHAPFNFPLEYADSYNPGNLPMGQQGPEDERWVPEMFRDLTEEERRGIIASYYTSVEYMDKNMGMVVDALDEMRLAENTLVIYISDQGYHLNDHGRFEKHTMYKEAVQAPLIVRGPGIPAGTRSDALIELVDLGPTITDLLGLASNQDWQGQSFRPVLTETGNEHREFVFSTFHHDNKAMVANKKWKYIFTTGHHDLDLNYKTGYGPSGIYHKLYDLENDPGELLNLAYQQEYLDTLRKFRDLMLQRFEQTHPYAQDCPEELNKLGQLVWYCEPRDAGSTYGPPVGVRIKDSLRIDIYD